MTQENKVEIQMCEWRMGLFPGHDEDVIVAAQVMGKAVLIVDGDQSWFEVDVLVYGEPHYAQYNEALLRWESGDL